MDAEQLHRLTELVTITCGVLPMVLILFAMILLRRQERTVQTFWLQLLAGAWLAISAAMRIALSQVVGIPLISKKIARTAEEAQHNMDFYFNVSSALHFAELVAAVVFAGALLVYFYQKSPGNRSTLNK